MTLYGLLIRIQLNEGTTYGHIMETLRFVATMANHFYLLPILSIRWHERPLEDAQPSKNERCKMAGRLADYHTRDELLGTNIRHLPIYNLGSEMSLACG